jgi:hypothetical protein
VSKGGSSSTPSRTTVTQSALPEYARPYFERLMGRSEATANERYFPYQGPRLAGFGADTQAAQQGARDMFALGTPGANQGSQYANTGTSQALSASNFQPGYTPFQFGFNQIQPQDFLGSGIYDVLRQRYMNPYIQDVVNVQKQGAIQDHNRLRNDRNAGYIKAGAFGGSRQAVSDYLGEEGLQNRLDQITKQGFSDAFGQAHGAALDSQRYNIDALMRGDIETGQRFMDAQQFQDSSNQFGEQARQRAMELGLQGSQIGIQGAATMADIDKTRQALLYEQIKNQAGVGADYDQLEQSGLDLAYQDFVNQRDYPRQSLGWLGGILHGVPVSNNQTVSEFQARNPMSQLLGLGVAGAGLYNMINTPAPGIGATG